MDFGASSMRFAVGHLSDSGIEFEIVAQHVHQPKTENGKLVWDIEALESFCDHVVAYAAKLPGRYTLGIDSWAVDQVFLDSAGKRVGPVVAYRDASHVASFSQCLDQHRALFAETGIQPQPFNTVFQLLARKLEGCSIALNWQMLPDYLGSRLTGLPTFERTNASTTMLFAPDGRPSPTAFAVCGWPERSLELDKPGMLVGPVSANLDLALVGTHDTASAVFGMGELAPSEGFLILGTWWLLGVVLGAPVITDAVYEARFSNEVAVDGRIRLLVNVPGAYLLNRLYDQLAPPEALPTWVANLPSWHGPTVNVLDDALFAPDSVAETLTSLFPGSISKPDLAPMLLASLAQGVGDKVRSLGDITGMPLTSLRVSGGGSQSLRIGQAIANAAQIPLRLGTPEATVLGNLAAQFVAQGRFASLTEASRFLAETQTLANIAPEGV